MKNSIIVSIFIFMNVHCVFAQVKIDDKYKNSGKTTSSVHPKTNTSEVAMKSILNSNISLLKKDLTDSEYQQKMKVADAEMKAFNINGHEVWLYEDTMYGGKKKVLKVGKYTLKDLGIYWNDKFSSMLIPVKLQVTLYANDGFAEPKSIFRGYGVRQCQQCYSTEPMVLSYDYGNFPSMGFMLGKEFISWNDAVSSIEIINN
jgi:hypothetical protein